MFIDGLHGKGYQQEGDGSLCVPSHGGHVRMMSRSLSKNHIQEVNVKVAHALHLHLAVPETHPQPGSTAIELSCWSNMKYYAYTRVWSSAKTELKWYLLTPLVAHMEWLDGLARPTAEPATKGPRTVKHVNVWLLQIRTLWSAQAVTMRTHSWWLRNPLDLWTINSRSYEPMVEPVLNHSVRNNID